ncbi:MAG TPA: hypothetical protein VM580_22255 [Labilithrix sp.]|nr:hypothetical protein [Labilithrix sp.]
MKTIVGKCLVASFISVTLLACASETPDTESLSETAEHQDALTAAQVTELFKLLTKIGKKEAYSDDICWRESVGRVGALPSTCPGGEKDGGLCYPACAEGYDGVGPVCWEICPAGYADVGALCHRFGQTFAKKAYGRGVGSPMSCAAGLEEDAGLCYEPCNAGYEGVGPVCWKSACPSAFPVECGAGCAKDLTTCLKATANQSLKSLQFISTVVSQDVVGSISKGIDAANAFNVPICK